MDGQWILRRNFCAIRSSRYPDYKSLIASFYSSVVNECSNCNAYNAFIIWDKGPYLKEQILTLKTSRYYANESDQQEIPEGVTEEERKAIEDKNKWIREQAQMESEFRHAKAHLIKFSREMGIPSVCYQGFEADDLAYIIANELGVKDDVKFLTKDSDWYYLMGPTTEFHRLTKNREYHKGAEVLKDRHTPLHIEGIFRTLIQGNHNDVETIDLGISVESALELYYNFQFDETKWTESVSKPPELVKKFLGRAKALDPRTFLTDEVKKSLLDQLQINVTDKTKGSMYKFCKDCGMFVNINKVYEFYSRRPKYLNLFESPIIKFPEI